MASIAFSFSFGKRFSILVTACVSPFFDLNPVPGFKFSLNCCLRFFALHLAAC